LACPEFLSKGLKHLASVIVLEIPRILRMTRTQPYLVCQPHSGSNSFQLINKQSILYS
jgi:hypothetical protein